MKKLSVIFCALSLIFSSVSLYAQEEASAPAKPVQVIQKGGAINADLKEPAGVDWSTGRGRKDGVLKWAVDDNYLKKVPGMLFRGISNAAFGWVEIFTHPFRWSRNAPMGLGTTTGLIMGPVMASLRTTSGALDIGTCWVPFWHGIPMSKPALGLRDVHHYGTIDDAGTYNQSVRRYGFNGLSDQY